MFSCEFCEICKNPFFTEHLRTTACVVTSQKHFRVLSFSINIQLQTRIQLTNFCVTNTYVSSVIFVCIYMIVKLHHLFYFCQSDNENTINWFYCIKNSFDTFLLIKYFVWSIRIIRGRVNENFYIWYYFLKRDSWKEAKDSYIFAK